MTDYIDDDKLFAQHLDEHKWDCIPDKFVVVDLETTGLTPKTDRIIEIGAILFSKDLYLTSGEVKNFQCFIKQENPIPTDSTAIHGITDEMVKDGDTEYSALSEFFVFSRGLPVYAYNAKFDRDFITETAKRCGFHDEDFKFKPEDILDTVDLVFDDLPNRKLETVANRLGYPTGKMHRALEDCALGLAVLIQCRQRLMIKQSTILREECLDLKKQTEELKGNENSTRRKGSSDKTLLWVSIGVSVALILAFAIPKS